jgi:DNA-binding response OmpR family regulator
MSDISVYPSTTQQRILVVDDDPQVRRLVELRLDSAGFEVLSAASAQEALDLVARHGLPHLAIVDIMMPGISGFEFCEALKQLGDVPVIMLTAVNEEEAIVRSIERCAEDYVTKPFRPRELVARVQRVLRRIGDFSYTLGPLIQVDDRLTVDFVHRQVIVSGREVALTPTETKLLYILMCNAGRAVTVDFLLRRLWPLEEASAEALRVHVHRLREKIEDDSNQPRYIATERGLGYRFEAEH